MVEVKDDESDVQMARFDKPKTSKVDMKILK
jgi:hypothetical protein